MRDQIGQIDFDNSDFHGTYPSALTIFTPLLVPRRVAPAAIIASASARLRTPPDALTPIAGPTVSRISATSAAVAPPVENPVEVLTKSAPASCAWRQAVRFSASVRRQV